MRIIANTKTPAYGYEGDEAIVDALCRGKTLEFENPEGRSYKVSFVFHNSSSRDEIRIINEDGTGRGIIAIDPFEWLFETLTANCLKLKTELKGTY